MFLSNCGNIFLAWWTFLCAAVKPHNNKAHYFVRFCGLENFECLILCGCILRWKSLCWAITFVSDYLFFVPKGKLFWWFFSPLGNHGDSMEEIILRETGDEMGPLTRLLPALMRFINNIGGHVIPVFSLVDNLCTLGPPLGLQLS
jgi:hypothetical protein